MEGALYNLKPQMIIQTDAGTVEKTPYQYIRTVAMNVIADQESREKNGLFRMDAMSKSFFSNLQTYGTPEIDLFSSRSFS